MDRVEYCLWRAEADERRAAVCGGTLGEQFLYMATQWRALATELGGQRPDEPRSFRSESDERGD